MRTIVLRAGDFYGGTKPQSWLDLIILAKLRKNIFTWGGPADIPHAFAYLPDLGRAFVALAEKRGEFAPFERFHFAGHTMSGLQMKAAAEAASGRQLKLKSSAVDAVAGRRPVQPDDARGRQDELSLAYPAFARRVEARADGRPPAARPIRSTRFGRRSTICALDGEAAGWRHRIRRTQASDGPPVHRMPPRRPSRYILFINEQDQQDDQHHADGAGRAVAPGARMRPAGMAPSRTAPG